MGKRKNPLGIALEDSVLKSFCKLCVYGNAGVGKTTFAKTTVGTYKYTTN